MPSQRSAKTVATAGVEIATERMGSGAGAAIVLVMGAIASMLWWPDRLCAALVSAGHPIVRYDNRDTGQSTTGPPGAASYTLDDLSDDLIAVMDAWALPSAHLVGMSLGGMIGQLTALRYPARVRSLTLIASEPLGGGGTDLPGIDPRFMAHFAGFASLDWADRAAVADFMVEIARLSSGTAHAFDEPAARSRIGRELDRAIDIRSAFNHALIGGAAAGRRDLRDITQPTLVIHGSEDPIIPLANGEAIAGQIPAARLVVLPGTGHELHDSDPSPIAAEIIAFVAAVDRNAGHPDGRG